MITVTSLEKYFGKKKVLNKLDLNVKNSSVYGLVGINGSGKTTVIKHICGIYKQDAGSVLVDDIPVFDSAEAKATIGLIPDELNFLHRYSLKSAANLYEGLYKDWNYDRYNVLIKEFSLNPNDRIGRFSKGMQKQAAFALALSCMPKNLILDEPLDGLDPLARRKVINFLINDVAEREMSVLISSHNLKELEGICDCVGIIDRGHTVVERDLDDLKSDIHKVQVAFADKNSQREYTGLNILQAEKHGSVELLVIKEKRDRIESVIKALDPVVFDVIPLTLEEVFVYEVGDTGRGGSHE